MDPPGFEPGASALQGRRSPSLSYGPILKKGMVELILVFEWHKRIHSKKIFQFFFV